MNLITNDDVNSRLPPIIVSAFQEWDNVIMDETVNLYDGSFINPDAASLRELLAFFLRYGANRSHADYSSCDVAGNSMAMGKAGNY